MDPLLTSVQEYIKSGEYFIDARKWYNFKYISPIIQRSLLLLFCVVFFLLTMGLIININYLLPIVTKVRYMVTSDTFRDSATITNANYIKNNPINSIADIMVRNYIIHRESYNYDLLTRQFMVIQNNSTRIIFKQFANFMNIDNPLSPVMRYQKSFRRSINILSVSYHKNNEAIVKFESLAKNNTNYILEDMIWEATVNFEIDKIDLSVPAGSRFDFAVTNYKIKLLEDKSNK